MSGGPASRSNANGGPGAAPAPPPPPAPAPAWTRGELADPHAREDKAKRVHRMFEAIAPSYDLNNRLHSLWLDQRWRRAAVAMAGVREGDRVLDVACGTGDLSLAFARTAAGEVVGADFVEAMLELARRKAQRRGAAVGFRRADAMDLPFDDASFDVLSIAFGIRNVQRPEVALGEFRRVLRPGGRLVVLEFINPRSRVLRALNDLYAGRIMPRTATLLSRDRSGAYRYLPESVRTFMDRAEMERAIEAAGFQSVRSRVLFPGICACYRGEAA